MVELLLFVEDDAQERFVARLARRLADEGEVPIRLRVRSSQGGLGRALKEVERLHTAWLRGRESAPDALIVAVDANCRGIEERRKLIDDKAAGLRDRVVHAIADPHIERWLLLDGRAFKEVVGRGCSAPDQKCEKGRFKRLLADAVAAAGVKPLLGGIEYAEELAEQIDIDRACESDRGFQRFVEELRLVLKRLKQGGR